MEMIRVGADATRMAVRLPNLDQPIRRIFNLDRFLEAVRTSELELRAPRQWEDPREDPATLCMLDGTGHIPGRAPTLLQHYLSPAWAQCWSLNHSSDTLLRAYSSVRPDPQSRLNTDRTHEGVTVTTKPQLLLSAAENWHADGADAHIVLGAVEYFDDSEIWQHIVNACNGEHGPQFFCTVQGRATSLLWKRRYFTHEQEVRLLLIGRSWQEQGMLPSRTRRVRIDPNVLFTSVSFDPRLQPFERTAREKELRGIGYVGEIRPDLSYQGMLGRLTMTRDWSDPD